MKDNVLPDALLLGFGTSLVLAICDGAIRAEGACPRSLIDDWEVVLSTSERDQQLPRPTRSDY
jgi:hypothetical protein